MPYEIWESFNPMTPAASVSSFSVQTQIAVWTPAAGKRFRLVAMMFGVDTIGIYKFRDGINGTVLAVFPKADFDTEFYDFRNGFLSTGENAVPLTCEGPAGSKITATFYGPEETAYVGNLSGIGG